MDWTVKVTDIAIVLAALLGPVLAVQAQKMLEKHRETRQRQAWIFRTLMATRATLLSQAHVEAINAIPIEFYGKTKALREIIDHWKSYIDHLGNDSLAADVWRHKRVELLVGLMHRLAKYLNFEFNTVEISKEFYSPKGHAEVENEQDVIRRGFAKLFSGEATLPLAINEFPVDAVTQAADREFRQLCVRCLKGDIALPVVVQDRAQRLNNGPNSNP